MLVTLSPSEFCRFFDVQDAYRHGLRFSELVDLHWEQIEFATAALHVRRVKQGNPRHPSHPRGRTAGLAAASARAETEVTVRVHVGTHGTLQHRRVRPNGRASGQGCHVGLQSAPAYLRDACGYTLANKGHDRRALQA